MQIIRTRHAIDGGAVQFLSTPTLVCANAEPVVTPNAIEETGNRQRA